MSAAAVEAVDRILAGDGEADDILRAVVGALVAEGCGFAWILFREDGELVPGPQAGVPDPDERTQVPVLFNSDHVADLVADGCAEPGFLAQIAVAIAPHCLVGWDTGGVPWDAD